jgi:hypothetical protein
MMEKLRVFPFQFSELHVEALRPSSHVSIWRAETTGTPWASAELTTEVDVSVETKSVCALTVNTP